MLTELIDLIVSGKSRIQSAELLEQKLSALTNSEDPQGIARTQLQLLQQRSTLEGFTPAELKRSLINVAADQISSFESSIALREAEWQLLEHILTHSEDRSLRNFLYERYQTDTEFCRGVTFASDAVYLRNLRHLQLAPVNKLSHEILEILRVSNWGQKAVEEERVIAAEELFLEVIKNKAIDSSGLQSLLHIPSVLELVSPRSNQRMRQIISKDKEFMSVIAIVSNQRQPNVLSEDLPKSSWRYRILKGV